MQCFSSSIFTLKTLINLSDLMHCVIRDIHLRCTWRDKILGGYQNSWNFCVYILACRWLNSVFAIYWKYSWVDCEDSHQIIVNIFCRWSTHSLIKTKN